jgi:serine/threonine-protein kinase CTR1
MPHDGDLRAFFLSPCSVVQEQSWCNRSDDSHSPNTLTNPDLIGSGGFGVVHKMHWSARSCSVAVKSVLCNDNKDVCALFQYEARLHVGLRHENILEILGIVTAGAYLQIVMPLMERSLFMAIHEDKEQFSRSIRVRICSEIAAGLQYLHTRSPPILHRDLKSPNVLLIKHSVKLVDFGFAKVKNAVCNVQCINTGHQCHRYTAMASTRAI